MICLQTVPGHLLYHSNSLLYSPHQVPLQWREFVLRLNAISWRTVNICHLHIYISCYYLLGLGLHAVSLGVLHFHWHGKDQVIIMMLHSGVLAVGVLYTSIPSGLNCVALSEMKNTSWPLFLTVHSVTVVSLLCFCCNAFFLTCLENLSDRLEIML